MKELISLNGADRKYWYNQNTGDIVYVFKGNIRILRKGKHRDDPGMCHVNIMMDGKYQFFTYHKLIALISIGMTNLRDIKKIISDRSNTGILRKIIVKDNDRSNGITGNITIGSMWVKLYYDNIINWDKSKINLTGVCSLTNILNDSDVFKDSHDLTIASVPLKHDDSIYVTAEGTIINLATGYVGKGYTSSYGYRTYSVSNNNKETVYNVNRLMWLAFINPNLTSEQLVVYKDLNTDRSVTKLSQLKVTTRVDRVNEYHKNNPDHFDKYLKDASTKGKLVKINDKIFDTLTKAAEYICAEEDIDKLASVKSLICLKLSGRVYNKTIYNKYKVEKVTT